MDCIPQPIQYLGLQGRRFGRDRHRTTCTPSHRYDTPAIEMEQPLFTPVDRKSLLGTLLALFVYGSLGVRLIFPPVINRAYWERAGLKCL